jgi:hypothetical protein
VLSEPQPPAHSHGDQPAEDKAQSRRQQAAEDSPTRATPRMRATRQGRLQVQAAHSSRSHPLPPRLGRAARLAHAAHTRTATTRRSALVPASSWLGDR